MTTAAKASWQTFPDYTTGSLIESIEVQPGAFDFAIDLTVQPEKLQYQILASVDKSGDRPRQFRLEAYQSGRVGFFATGIQGIQPVPWGDTNRHGSALSSPTAVLSVGTSTNIKVTRTGSTFKLFVNDVQISDYTSTSVHELTKNSDGKIFRIGSRLPEISDPFQGTITAAKVLVEAMPWKYFAGQDHVGGDKVILNIGQDHEGYKWKDAMDSNFLRAIKKFCAAKGYNCFTVMDDKIYIKEFASPISAEGGLNPKNSADCYILQKVQKETEEETGGYAAKSAGDSASDWEKFSRFHKSADWEKLSGFRHTGCDVGFIHFELKAIGNDPAWTSALSEFCSVKGFNGFTVGPDEFSTWLKKCVSPIAAKGTKVAEAGCNFYVAEPGPVLSGWQSFPGQVRPHGDEFSVQVGNGMANDPAFVEAMQVLCDKKGYKSFNINNNKDVYIKNFSSPLAAEEGMLPNPNFKFYINNGLTMSGTYKADGMLWVIAEDYNGVLKVQVPRRPQAHGQKSGATGQVATGQVTFPDHDTFTFEFDGKEIKWSAFPDKPWVKVQ